VIINARQRALPRPDLREIAALRDHGVDTGKAGAAHADVALDNDPIKTCNGSSCGKTTTFISTNHPLQAVERMLTDRRFSRDRTIVRKVDMRAIGEQFTAVMVNLDHAETARNLKPFDARQVFGASTLCLTATNGPPGMQQAKLANPPSRDRFVATMKVSYA